MQVLRHRADQKGLYLSSDFDPSAPRTVMGDAARVRQILVNYISNAVKSRPHRSRQRGSRPGGVRCGKGRRAASISISVTDTGIGIPPEKQQELFGKFVQVDSSSAAPVQR